MSFAAWLPVFTAVLLIAPFSAASSKPIGPLELEPLLVSTSNPSPTLPLQSTDLPNLMQDLSARFVPSAANDHEAGLEEIIGPLVNKLGLALVTNRTDIGGGGKPSGHSWRDAVLALQSLAENKGVASMLPEVSNWDVSADPRATPPALEMASLLGPFLRLSTFPDAFVSFVGSMLRPSRSI